MEYTLKTTTNSKGKIVYFHPDDFIQQIVVENGCFICGAKLGTKVFNDEHILPNWLLSKYNLHNKTVSLPNSVEYTYSKYKISCCQDCNYELSKHFEKPLSTLLKLPYLEAMEEIKRNPSYFQLLFEWCVAIFFKAHLKDMNFYWHLNRSIENRKIADAYEWFEFHHIHCLLRRFYSKAIVDYSATGSVFLLPALQIASLKGSTLDEFDFVTNTIGQSILLRLNEFAIICVLDDGHATNSIYNREIEKITGPLTPLQLREIFCHVTYININLKERPKFFSEYHHHTEEYFIRATVPEFFEVKNIKEEILSFGKLMGQHCIPLIGKIPNKKEVVKAVKNGRYTFLFNNQGKILIILIFEFLFC